MSPSYIKRWYDRDQFLSELVRIIEHLSQPSAELFGKLVENLATDYMKNMGMQVKDTKPETLNLGGEGMMGTWINQLLVNCQKADANSNGQYRRWYDQNDFLRIAFERWFAVPEAQREALAAKLINAALLTEDYETLCVENQQSIRKETIEMIVEQSFQRPKNNLFEWYHGIKQSL